MPRIRPNLEIFDRKMETKIDSDIEIIPEGIRHCQLQTSKKYKILNIHYIWMGSLIPELYMNNIFTCFFTPLHI